MMMADASPMALADGLRLTPRPASAISWRGGCASSTAKYFGSSPSPSQPSSRAPPIFPAPTSRIVLERFASVRAPVIVIAVVPRSSFAPGRDADRAAHGASSLACGLEHGGIEGLAGSLAGPDHELEGREIALAAIERGPQQSFALPARGFHAARQDQRVPVHHDAVLGPQIEMPDPHLLVDQRDQLLHHRATALRHLELERAGQMQGLDVVHPGEGDLIVGPFPAHQDGDLVLAGALERPVVRRRHAFYDLEGIEAR